MNIVRIAYTFLLAASLPCAIFLIRYACKRRTVPGANYFILLMLAAIVYNGGYIGEINSASLSTAMVWFDLEHLAIPLEHYFWLMMSLEYVRAPKRFLKMAKYIMLYHPVSYLVIYFTNRWHHLYIPVYRFVSNDYFPVIVSSKGVLYILMVASGTLMGLIATFFYIRAYLHSPRLHRYGHIIMILASLLPWFSVYLDATNTSYLGIDYYPVVSIFSGLLYAFGIFKFRVFRTIPLAMQIVFRNSKEGTLLIDLTDRLIDVNDAFLKIYPELNKLSDKYTFASFIQAHPELNGLSEGNDKLQYQRMINGEEGYFSAEITEILTEDGLQIGKILTINDVTLFVEHQKRLEAMASMALTKAETNEMSFLQAQIKPHFLNNTLSVIASMITVNPEEAKNLIGNLGEYLSSCCYFDSTSLMAALEKELEIVNTYVAIEKARFGERLNFQVICDKIPDLKIPRLVLQPLVENAIRHGILKKSEGGNVKLTIRCEGGKINFEIQDDGVGMGEEQINALEINDEQKTGVGLINIHKRLLKCYGEGLNIVSVRGQGTSVAFSVLLKNNHQLDLQEEPIRSMTVSLNGI
ncbi:putative regulator of cell autolysis [Desulfosporosinus acidiphilus SJ4]|uniref:Putative regulator of cell autolysis n=1 Tax=Desulfosporosinus acidiphilus (strain DSM 22704 / JCM 16185 / SJ4) TaxID=646529 RepID=I4DC17_DESAJ|nr:histidine kinase N-terminal 7TM domain-containing protein [Desulfosporosinus acidiphilus]AFM43341.1 putative regulator of cell autolysis [Desulfosporosinus acidiphilus SJ4]